MPGTGDLSLIVLGDDGVTGRAAMLSEGVYVSSKAQQRMPSRQRVFPVASRCHRRMYRATQAALSSSRPFTSHVRH